MVTMRLWLGRLAAGFALAAGGFTSYVYSETLEGRVASAQAGAGASAPVEGRAGLAHMMETAAAASGGANGPTVTRGSAPPIDAHAKAELPFKIVAAAERFANDPYRRSAKAAEFADEAALAAAASQGVAALALPNGALTATARHAAANMPAQVVASVRGDLAAQAVADQLATQPAPETQTLADGTSGTERARPHPVEDRINARVVKEMRQFFDLYLYVSKSEKGSWAQRMYVMAKQPDDRLALVHEWLVSTGKEEMMTNPHGEVMNTDTPEGFFRLDRSRFFADYTSRQWKAPMPHAMFFDWQIEGRPSGLAIHGTGPTEEEDLGRRASKGCIRLAPEDAKRLFQLITENYAGRVPQLKIDPNTGTQSTNGLMRRDAQGRILTKYGYRVLVVIENYGGPSTDTIATIM
jgi:lipoprotein-anchoring transpeptidase ErfK/SrfK